MFEEEDDEEDDFMLVIIQTGSQKINAQVVG
jgi:hypothetical protein